MTDAHDQRAPAAGTQHTRTKGPRGGRTTISRKGWVKKNLWITPELAEALREKAFRHRIPEAEIIRQALQTFLPKLSLAVVILGVGISS
jgi:hypothetical protein